MNMVSILTVAGAFIGAGDDVPKQAAGLHALVEGGAEGRLQAWEFTDANAWRVTKVMDRDALEQYQASEYQPKVRSPLNIAWLRGIDVTDFVLDLMAQSTARDYGHRDVCLFFGR